MSADPYKYFRVEARELTEELSRGIAGLAAEGRDPERVPRLLRLAHTLKGAARVVKQRQVADLAHAVEDALEPLREGGEPLSRDRVEALLGLLDDISRRVASLGAPPGEAAQPAAAEPLRTLRVDVEEVDALLTGLAEVHTLVDGLRKSAGEVRRARDLAELLTEHLAGARSRSLSVELATTCRALERGLPPLLDQIGRELAAVSDAAQQLRLMPVREIFPPLASSARDAARELGKRVALQAAGGDTRLEPQVLSAVQAALVQIVRNAVAHGIEPEAERLALGKPAEGRISLEVARRGRQILFRCEDDGSGVDLEAVRRAARRRGLAAEELARLDAAALFELLLRGGISTSEAVTGVAGRGIGLDVVRDVAHRLGGRVQVRTQAGRGTTIEIVLPLSLAALEVLSVEHAGRIVAIPLEAVRHSLRVGPDDISTAGESESVLIDGQVVPFSTLARVLGDERGAAPSTRPRPTVVLAGGAGLGAIGVERLHGTARAVLSPLPELAACGAVVSGAWIDTEGNPRLVLDPDELVLATRRMRRPEPTPAARPLPLLVIDDSLTTRMLEQSILESAGYEVHLASSGEEALEAARRASYALFLVDIEMPGMDGFTFIERCRADPALHAIPAILVSSRAAAEDRQQGERVGARGYIVKGEFDQVALLELIRGLVG